MDILTLLLQYINLAAALVGVVMVQVVKYMLPSPTPDRTLDTVPGHLGSRLLPLVGPVSAVLTCVVLEWGGLHPELGGKSGVVPNDIVRGILSGWASDFFLRIYYKSIVGV